MAFYKATMADLNTVVELVQGIIGKQYKEYYNPETVEFLKKQYAKIKVREIINNDMVVIQTEADYPMAVGALSYDVISALYVHPEYQRQGCGERLLRKLEEMARDNGQSSLRVVTHASGKDFFEHEGYELIADKEIPMEDGKTYICCEMEKTL